MPDNIEKYDENKEAGSKSERQYYVEGYYDTAFSMPAETDGDYTYKIGSSSSLPAFPPHNAQLNISERFRPLKTTVMLFFGLFVVIIVLAVVWFFLRYDMEIESDNGIINITLTESKRDSALFYELFPPAPQASEPPGDTDHSPDTAQLKGYAMVITELPADAQELSYQQIYKKCIDSIVSVYSVNNSGQSIGTGIVLSTDGYILTNQHIVDSQSEIFVILSGSEQYKAVMVGKDTVTDLAVLKIDAKRLKPAEFGDSHDLQVGDSIIAIGNPINYTLMMTDGIISAINDRITLNGYKTTLLQTNAQLGDGSSGGALINNHGQIIGITNMKIVSAYQTTEDIGFAIPVSVAKPIVEELLLNGYIKGRPSIGIIAMDVPRVVSVFYDMPSGVYVDYVWENSDAYKKGLMRGDIIVSADGIQITGLETLLEIQNGLSVGDTINLEIFRQGQYYMLEITLMDASSFD